MSEINAAFGLLQLESIGEAIAMRKKVDRIYREAFLNVPGIECLAPSSIYSSNFSYFPVMIKENYPMSRDDLYYKMKSKNIFARRYFYPLISDFPMYRTLPSAERSNLPNATKAANQVLCLPIYPHLSSANQARVIECIEVT